MNWAAAEWRTVAILAAIVSEAQMRPKSAAERKQEERDRYRAAGLVAVQVWIRPEDRERLHRYVERLNRKAKGGT